MLPAALLVVTLAATPLRVEAGAALGGDGSAERPFARISEALARAPPGGTVSIGPGLYEEALDLAAPVTIVGGKGVVIAAPPGSPTTLHVRADATLRDVRVQGGRVGIEVDGARFQLERGELAGQPDVGLHCGSGAHCTIRDGTVTSSFASAVGLRSSGRLDLERVRIQGPFRRALESEGHLVADDLEVSGANTGLQLHGGDSTLRRPSFVDLRGTCVFGSGGHLRILEGVFSGCDVAVEVREKSVLELRGAIVVRAKRAGVAATGCETELVDSIFEGPFTTAGVIVLGGRAAIHDVRIRQPGVTGVLTRLARVTLERVTVDGATLDASGDFGNALYLYDSQVSGTDVLARSCAGSAIEAQVGSGRLANVEVEGVGLAGVALEHQAHLDLPGLSVRGGAGVGLACIEEGASHLALPKFERLGQGSWLVDCGCHLDVQPRTDGPACGARR